MLQNVAEQVKLVYVLVVISPYYFRIRFSES